MHVKIVSEGHGIAKVFIDGKEQQNVVSASVYLSANSMNTVTLEYLADQVEIEAQEIVREDEKGRTL